ncbi:MAG: hypothetical protein H6Q05_3205 [Acidobacteria bacterium]|nr:hypothetical protein [Acidobacteriota bacterium]
MAQHSLVSGNQNATDHLKHLKYAETGNFTPAPLHLLIIPTIVILCQLTLIDRAIEYSGSYAIKKSQALIHDIGAYRKANGRPPTSWHAIRTDCQPGIVGIQMFYYEPNGNAYNLFFEQLLSRFGTRDVVMHNKLDERFFTSHDSDLLLWTKKQPYARRTCYALHHASTPHWKIFWFD